ncbi:MAG: hypothetical protein AAGF97_13515 [Planctomycetota bacterium]
MTARCYSCIRWITVVVCLNGTLPFLHADEDLEIAASWEVPAAAELMTAVELWTEGMTLNESERAAVQAAEESLAEPMSPSARFDRLITLIAVADPSTRPVIDACQSGAAISVAKDFDSLVVEQDWPPVVANHLRLLLGRSLAMEQLFDEALLHLQPLELGSVTDPATLLFYRGATEYRLRQQDASLATLGKLLERDQEIASRYATIARLMEAELKTIKPDSLGEIAHLMDSVRVRLGHGRAGKRVRDEEQEVIDKLDKMIEQLEDQLQQMQGMAGNQGGNLAPSSPLQDSRAAGGSGPGNVDPEPLDEEAEWGNISPKQREKTLQQLGEEYPSHYRSVIEEYFRQLAKEDQE